MGGAVFERVYRELAWCGRGNRRGSHLARWWALAWRRALVWGGALVAGALALGAVLAAVALVAWAGCAGLVALTAWGEGVGIW